MGIGNNWDQLIRLIIPLCFLLIWAVTSLFNREGKPTPSSGRMLGPPGTGPRPGEPTLRWGPTAASSAGSTARKPASGDDGILIIRPSPTTTRAVPTRAAVQAAANRKGAKPARVAQPAPKRAERAPSTPKLAGVTQNVNQQLTRSSIELSPLDPAGTTTAAGPLGLASAPEALASRPAPGAVGRGLSASLRDPDRLREAFLLNELLRPPLALRPPGERRA